MFPILHREQETPTVIEGNSKAEEIESTIDDVEEELEVEGEK